MQSPTFESTSGRRASLSDFRGRPAVVFYESRGHDRDNDEIKVWCGRLAAQGILDVTVLGVANLKGYGFAPIRKVVKPAVKAIAQSYGIEIWMDFDGALLERPWNLRKDAANVAIFDADGQMVFAEAGALDEAGRERFLGVLRAQATGGEAERIRLPDAA